MAERMLFVARIRPSASRAILQSDLIQLTISLLDFSLVSVGDCRS